MTTNRSSPVRYSPLLEHIDDDEAEVQAELVEQLKKIGNIVHEHTGHSYRSVHAKSHGLLIGQLEVHGDLPPALSQGLFARPGTYDAVIRLSTSAGDLLADSVSLPRAMAVKIIGVEGPRVEASIGDTTQDFVMVNGPVFVSKNTRSFLSNLKMLAATTDKVESFKKGLSTVLRGVEKVVESVGAKSGKLTSMGGQPETHLLGETFFTQVPLRYGDYIAKVGFFPASAELKALTGAHLDAHDRPNAVREAVVAFFLQHGGTWDVRVQLMTDARKMPIEDASVEWPQKLSPYVTVATLRVDPQPAWDEERFKAIDDGLAFNPWHALAAHQPLGNVMRARRVAYEVMSSIRRSRSGAGQEEPRSLGDLGLKAPVGR